MDYALDDDQVTLQDVLRQFFTQRVPDVLLNDSDLHRRLLADRIGI